MLLNQFSVRVAEGAESNGYVELTHGQEYTLHLRNMNSNPCDAEVEVDGKSVGAFRINAHSSMTLERPQNDQGRFTFVVPGSKEAIDGQLDVNSPNLGLIKVTFKLGRNKQAKPVVSVKQQGNWRAPTEDAAYTAAASGMPSATLSSDPVSRGAGPGGTVLTGHSDQQFTSVENLEYIGTPTIIYLRLVSRGTASDAHPLVASTPIPPRIG